MPDGARAAWSSVSGPPTCSVMRPYPYLLHVFRLLVIYFMPYSATVCSAPHFYKYTREPIASPPCCTCTEYASRANQCGDRAFGVQAHQHIRKKRALHMHFPSIFFTQFSFKICSGSWTKKIQTFWNDHDDLHRKYEIISEAQKI